MLQRKQGLTLIEVLIALAIISIALTAIIKATSQSLQNNAYLEDKTVAMWVAQQAMNEVLIQLRKPDDTHNELFQTTMLGRLWYWKIYREDTPNKNIKKIIVQVFPTEDAEASPIITLESFTYHAD